MPGFLFHGEVKVVLNDLQILPTSQRSLGLCKGLDHQPLSHPFLCISVLKLFSGQSIKCGRDLVWGGWGLFFFSFFSFFGLSVFF